MNFISTVLRRGGIRGGALRQATVLSRNTNRPAVWRCYSDGQTETNEQFDARWVNYFNRPNIDSWDLKKGLNELYGHDLVPEPQIVVAMLKAARRINDVAMGIRILEAVKEKAAGSEEIYSYIIKEVKPALDELGISTPEELGLA